MELRVDEERSAVGEPRREVHSAAHEELEADLEGAHVRREPRRERARAGLVFDVEREDHPVAGRGAFHRSEHRPDARAL